jgi:hypothetical protein
MQTPHNLTAKSELGFIIDGMSTGISTLTPNTQHLTPIYDLLGRRVVSPKSSEIYIINGKKAIFK